MLQGVATLALVGLSALMMCAVVLDLWAVFAVVVTFSAGVIYLRQRAYLRKEADETAVSDRESIW